MDDEKRWQDMDSEEQAKRITELEHRIETSRHKQGCFPRTWFASSKPD
jgi:hypothetical protein